MGNLLENFAVIFLTQQVLHLTGVIHTASVVGSGLQSTKYTGPRI